MAKRFVTVQVDFAAEAWPFWDAIERHPCIGQLHTRIRALVTGDEDTVRVVDWQWQQSKEALASVAGWNTGRTEAPHPLKCSE